MNKLSEAYEFGVQQALQDAELVKKSGLNALEAIPLAGIGIGAGVGAGIGLANRNEGDIFGRGEESRLGAALKGGAAGGATGGVLGLAGDLGLVALALRGLKQRPVARMGQGRIPISTNKMIAGGYL